MPDFETRSPPEPGRLGKLLASMVAASKKLLASMVATSRRLGATAAGILRSMNRHRWAAGFVVVFVMVLAAGSTVYWLNFMPEAPRASEPWPPDYRVGEDPNESGWCESVSLSSSETQCYWVYTHASDEKSLRHITRFVSHGSPYANVQFLHPPERFFALGCKKKHYGIDIVYHSDSCTSGY